MQLICSWTPVLDVPLEIINHIYFALQSTVLVFLHCKSIVCSTGLFIDISLTWAIYYTLPVAFLLEAATGLFILSNTEQESYLPCKPECYPLSWGIGAHFGNTLSPFSHLSLRISNDYSELWRNRQTQPLKTICCSSDNVFCSVWKALLRTKRFRDSGIISFRVSPSKDDPTKITQRNKWYPITVDENYVISACKAYEATQSLRPCTYRKGKPAKKVKYVFVAGRAEKSA